MKSFKEKIKKTIFFPIGISGSGKGHYFKYKILKQFPELETKLQDMNLTMEDIIICPDDIRKEVTGSISDQTRNPYVWALASTRAKAAVKNYGLAILDATNTNGKSRNQFIGQFPGAEKVAIVFKPDIDLSFERITNDITSGVDRSDVPMDVLQRQLAQFKASVVGDPNWDGEWNERTKDKIREQLNKKFDVIKFVE